MDEDGFVRQRRNIIVISLVLLFFQGTDLTLRELNILGNKAELGKPIALAPLLWLAWFYLLLRYWQAFNEVGQPKFRKAFNDHLTALIHRYVVASLQSAPLPAPNAPEDASHQQDPSISQLARPGWLTAKVVLRHTFQSQGTGAIYQKEREWALGTGVVLRLNVAAALHVILITSLVTEHYLPFAIGAAPIAYSLWTQHRG